MKNRTRSFLSARRDIRLSGLQSTGRHRRDNGRTPGDTYGPLLCLLAVSLFELKIEFPERSKTIVTNTSFIFSYRTSSSQIRLQKGGNAFGFVAFVHQLSKCFHLKVRISSRNCSSNFRYSVLFTSRILRFKDCTPFNVCIIHSATFV